MPHKSFGFSEGSVGAWRPRRCILTLGFGKGAGVALRRERWKGRVGCKFWPRHRGLLPLGSVQLLREAVAVLTPET